MRAMIGDLGARRSSCAMVRTMLGGDTEIPGTLPWRIVAAVPNFVLAGTFVVTWVSPSALGERMIPYLVLVMLLEFFILHSSALLGAFMAGEFPRTTKTLIVLVLAVAYTLFVGAFSLAFRTWWPLVTFWLLTLNRLLGPFLRGHAATEREKIFVFFSWGVGVVAYLVFAFATTLLPVARLGVSEAVVRAQRVPGEGLWIDEPHRVLAFGVYYFTVMGLWELGRYANPGGGTKA